SIDPFTNGHLDIVKKAAALFDEVYVVIGVNANKNRCIDSKMMQQAIEATIKDLHLNNVYVTIFDGLVAEYAKENQIQYMIRGLRNNMDYNYEENIAEVNKLINPQMEYVYFRAENVAVSSSMVKELHGYGQDVSKYLPSAVYQMLKQ
ncbi:MAG: pantetheine-phosphate adenylyltransferase, partial [Clostridia bacterium]|nr:pantetheine-phosphate adenylyltransferase [Clostridia bacterium]